MLRLLLISSLFIAQAHAEISLGGFAGSISAEQNDLNRMMARSNTRAGGIPTSALNSALELAAYFQYRVDKSIWAFQIKPSYVFKTSSGSGGTNAFAGKYSYGVQGVTVAAITKLYALEGKYLRLYFSGGLNYGSMAATIQEVGFNVKASRSSMGFEFGTGLEFTFGNHGILFDATLRQLSINRMTVDSTSGTAESGSASQYGDGQELELDNSDLGTTFSGMRVSLGYAYYF